MAHLGYQFRQISGPRIDNPRVNQHNNFGGDTVGVVVDLISTTGGGIQSEGIMSGVTLTSVTFRTYAEAEHHVETMLRRFVREG